MDVKYLLVVVFLSTVLLLATQRTEAKRRKFVLLFVLGIGLLLRHNAFLKDLHTETVLGMVIGLLISGLFWLIIGRYNPVGSSDNIKVMGLDD